MEPRYINPEILKTLIVSIHITIIIIIIAYLGFIKLLNKE